MASGVAQMTQNRHKICSILTVRLPVELFEKLFFERHPSQAQFLSLDYLREAEQQNYVHANRRLYRFNELLKFGNISLIADTVDLKEYCDRMENYCQLSAEHSS